MMSRIGAFLPITLSLVAQGYDLCSGTYSVGDYTCQTPSGENDTIVFYPCSQTTGSFPAIILAHGSGGRGEIDDLKEGPIRAVVSSGFIVIAPYTDLEDSSTCNSDTEYKDVLHAIKISEGKPTLHKALPRVSWDRIGVWGNSMGGKTVPLAATSDDRIKAMVCAYGARKSSSVGKMPSMYITGTRDDSSSPADTMHQEFESNPSEQKIFLNFDGVAHMGNMMDEWIAKFLACHVGTMQDACDKVYANSPAICHGKEAFAKNGCTVCGVASTPLCTSGYVYDDPIDGKMGSKTATALQDFLWAQGLTPDGDGKWDFDKSDSPTTKALQEFFNCKGYGLDVDGQLGEKSTRALQSYLNANGESVSEDGKFGDETKKALQQFLKARPVCAIV
jgi:dienelactone hydrolase